MGPFSYLWGLPWLVSFSLSAILFYSVVWVYPWWDQGMFMLVLGALMVGLSVYSRLWLRVWGRRELHRAHSAAQPHTGTLEIICWESFIKDFPANEYFSYKNLIYGFCNAFFGQILVKCPSRFRQTEPYRPKIYKIRKKKSESEQSHAHFESNFFHLIQIHNILRPFGSGTGAIWLGPNLGPGHVAPFRDKVFRICFDPIVRCLVRCWAFWGWNHVRWSHFAEIFRVLHFVNVPWQFILCKK